MLAHRHLDVLLDGETRKQRALLKHHADAPLDRAMFVRREGIEIAAKNLDKAAAFADEPQNRPGEDRFAGARPTDESRHLAPVNVEIEALQDELVAKAHDEIAHLYRDLWRRAPILSPGGMLRQCPAVCGGPPVAQYPIPAKNMANNPSTTTTMNIDLTTEAVTCRPSDSAEPATARPSTQEMSPMTSAMKGALMRPHRKVWRLIADCNPVINLTGVIPS